MKKSNLLLKRKPGRIFQSKKFICLILFLQAFVLTSTAQSYQQKLKIRSDSVHNYSDTVTRWLDWNILFPKNTSDQDKTDAIDKLIAKINDTIAQQNASRGQNFKVDYHVVYCPCDSQLTNLNATPAIGASGNTVPPTPPGTGGSGDIVSFNFPMDQDPPLQEGKYILYNVTQRRVPLTIGSIDKKKLLAIMDTGLDLNLLPPGFNVLLWKDPKSRITLRNFQFYHNHLPLDYMLDDQVHVHGTAVATIALQEFEKETGRTKPKPMIMVLKVLDEQGKGNIFSVSCGLSYAVQKKATLVNASLGYYGLEQPDLILLHYVNLTNNVNPLPIPILAAAGNTRGIHNPSLLCKAAPDSNQLTVNRTFYPASFSKSVPDVISVTTIQDSKKGCFFQNYSNEYVSVGVANEIGAHCCKFIVPFQTFGYEGSSFATPFISGKLIACLMEGRTLQNCRDQWRPSTPGLLTKDGKFVPNP